MSRFQVGDLVKVSRRRLAELKIPSRYFRNRMDTVYKVAAVEQSDYSTRPMLTLHEKVGGRWVSAGWYSTPEIFEMVYV